MDSGTRCSGRTHHAAAHGLRPLRLESMFSKGSVITYKFRTVKFCLTLS